MRYTKPALTFDQQLDRLRERGLTIHDPARATHWLRKVSYYRLSAYCLPFKDADKFRPGTTFDQIAGLYIFDRKLRLLVMDAIERIEIAARTSITYEIAHTHGPFGHADSVNFDPKFNHAEFMKELALEEKRARETFVAHFRAKYAEEPHLPVWMATELMSLGAVSKLYVALQPKIKQRIADDFGVDKQFLVSWLHVLSYVRNICAHHKRLWNRELAVKPKLPSRCRQWPHQVPDNGHLYAVLVVMRHMLGIVSPNCKWRERLFCLLDEHQAVPLDAMRFPANWRTLALWR